MVKKGKVSTILDGGTFITATPYTGGTVTAPLTVPFFLLGDLPVGTPIAYADFEDNTGIVLSRMDGDWNNGIQPVEPIEIKAVVEDGVCKVICSKT